MAGEADIAGEAADQGLDRQGGVGEVGVDALVLGEPFPEVGRQLFPGLGLPGGDAAGDALGDGLAPVVLLVLPTVAVGLGLALSLLMLLSQFHLEGDGAADAEKEVAEAGLGSPGAVEIAGVEGGDAL